MASVLFAREYKTEE